MININNIQGLLFDYGGTIDSNGMHWAEVIWMAYQAARIPVTKDLFREAYVYGERTLARNRIILPHHTFRDMMCLKIALQFNELKENQMGSSPFLTPDKGKEVADWCYRYACQSIERARPILEELAKRYPLVLVSNFYGNIESVLNDFQLDGYFNSIVESAVVGIRKPDPAIFSLGVKELKVPAEKVVVIGDSYEKDIVPATHIGCKTIWLKNIGWEAYKGTEIADVILSDFRELEQVFDL